MSADIRRDVADAIIAAMKARHTAGERLRRATQAYGEAKTILRQLQALHEDGEDRRSVVDAAAATRLALSVACGFCEASIGEPCVSSGGKPCVVHKSRLRRAAKAAA